jgi:hypothetical protein
VIKSARISVNSESGCRNWLSARAPTRDVSRPQLLHSQQTQQTSQPQQTAAEIGVHPLVIKIAVGAAVWFVVTSWLAFAWDSEIDYLLVIVTLFFAIFFTLFLLTASFSVHDARWPVRHTSFREFLNSDIRIGRGTMSGREVLFEIALIPVALAFGATLIVLAWVIFG